MEVTSLLTKYGVAYQDNEKYVKCGCPFHDDKNQDDAVIYKNSAAFRCFACNTDGDIYDYLAKRLGTVRSALLSANEAAESDTVDASLVERWHAQLLANPAALKPLAELKGINLDTVKSFRIGLNGGRYPIPIPNGDGTIYNVRSWSPIDKERKVIGLAGKKRQLFPINQLDAGEQILIVEGELKALLCIQAGFNAISATGGATTWEQKWGELFKGKDVVVIYDIDEPGRNGAFEVCRSVVYKARSVKNLVLPLDPSKYPTGGVDDYLHKEGHTAAELRELINKCPFHTTLLPSTIDPAENEILPVSLNHSSMAKYYHKFLKVSCVVSAKDTAPYLLPRKFAVGCAKDEAFCAACPISSAKGQPPTVELSCKDPILLELVGSKVDRHQNILRKAASIPQACRSAVCQVQETHNVEEVRLIPQLKVAANQQEHVVRRAFFVGHGIETNTAYDIEARCLPEPNSQYATLLIYHAESSVDSLSTFKVTDHVKERLRIFQADPTPSAIHQKLSDIYADLSRNVTRIRQREDLHLLYDLCYHSVLYVPFNGRNYKGWCEVLALGDSGQGKSETLERLVEHYQLGEKVDCKGASIAGLLGGLQETSRRWFISWGQITLNDRRLVALEEAKGLSTDTIAKMTDARSSGIIEISKIEKAKTTCRCRLIWITNPRSQRAIETYNYGIEAVKELIGALEDVRRFDAAVIVASGDVPDSVINVTDKQLAPIEHKYTSAACRDLILWAWSRQPDEVVFEDDTVEKIMQVSQELAKKYSANIPLVEPADQRIKIARLAAALAARLYSTDETGVKLLVKPAHVEVVNDFLNRSYSSKAFGYHDYSALVEGESKLEDEETIVKNVLALPHAKDVVNAFLELNTISLMDFMDLTGRSGEESRQDLGFFVRKRALKRHRSVYIKTPAFLRLLKDLRDKGKWPGTDAPPHIKDIGDASL